MTDTLISLDTAILAKTKGFNEWCSAFYLNSRLEYEMVKGSDTFDNVYPACTQSLLQKWLREVHCLSVEVYYLGKDDWGWGVYTIEEASYEVMGSGDSTTYEQALEAGLKHSLELL